MERAALEQRGKCVAFRRRTDGTYRTYGTYTMRQPRDCAPRVLLRGVARSTTSRFVRLAGVRAWGPWFLLAFAHFSPFHGDHTNVVVEVFSRRKTTDFVNNGREELFYWQICHTVETRDE